MGMVLLRKTLGAKLEPVDDAGRDALSRIAAGNVVRAEITRPRNLAHHRKYWALISLIYQNQTRYQSPEELNDAIKVHVGHASVMVLRDGTEVRVPKSIAFHAMNQDEFDSFYSRVIDCVVSEIIPGLNRGDLERELMEFAS